MYYLTNNYGEIIKFAKEIGYCICAIEFK